MSVPELRELALMQNDDPKSGNPMALLVDLHSLELKTSEFECQRQPHK